MKKIVSVLGARPQFIKAAVLSRIIREKGVFKEVIIHTGQHFDNNMSEVFFKQMDIPKPTYFLNINSLGHGAMTGRMLEQIEKVLLDEQPDLVIVYGDTNSTLAGALAAKKLHIPVAHVEAGLRSYNMRMPEEINRILTDRISDLLFCPTSEALSNLEKEGCNPSTQEMILSGDIMKDSVDYYSLLAEQKSNILERMALIQKEFVLATIHRQENTSDPEVLRSIIEGLNGVARETLVVMPVHPRTKAALESYHIVFDGILIDPVGYFDMLQLLKHCKLVVTDSGGLQKEAYFNHKPCVIVRSETEWVELVEAGYASIAGNDAQQIKEACRTFQQHPPLFQSNLYGKEVGQKIYKGIEDFLL